VEVVHHDFFACIDTCLQQENCYLLNLKDPTHSLKAQPNKLSDIHSGNLYKMGWKEFCTGLTDVLCALIFFIDKTHTDVQGKLNVEPVQFTFSIFNLKTCNQVHAWRTLCPKLRSLDLQIILRM